jgi:hypothetical protein
VDGKVQELNGSDGGRESFHVSGNGWGRHEGDHWARKPGGRIGLPSDAVSFCARRLGVRTIETTATVTPDGKLMADVPADVAPGEHRVVVVIEDLATERDDASDLVSAASSTLAFWDNPYDDEDWNDA